MSDVKPVVVVPAEDEADAERTANLIIDTVGYSGNPQQLAGGWMVVIPFMRESTTRSAATIVTRLTGLEAYPMQVDRETSNVAAVRWIEKMGGPGKVAERAIAGAVHAQGLLS